MSNNDERYLIEKQIPEVNRMLLASGRMLSLDQADIEDLISETWTTFLEKRANFRGESKLSTYLFGVFYNKYRQQKRKKRPLPSSDRNFDELFNGDGLWAAEVPQPDAVFESLEIRGRLKECFDNIGEKLQQGFLMRHILGESSKKICKILDVSITNLGVMLFRAKNQLRKCLESK